MRDRKELALELNRLQKLVNHYQKQAEKNQAFGDLKCRYTNAQKKITVLETIIKANKKNNNPKFIKFIQETYKDAITARKALVYIQKRIELIDDDVLRADIINHIAIGLGEPCQE